ncbi:hypothetical protein DY000_02002800 [Brassica cretica]|uniref:Uncharacterized protein n=1 Tax=Brassica cretica TaxID=69181 RepID=A0ABQ7CD79_BRACR|nr:hypothetical protein DY000_02002800 [Brassica cretica]
MGDHDNQDDLAAAMALMQQQMLQMQQTMQAREQAFQKAAEHAAQQQQQQGAFALIKNMASSSANKNPEADCSTKVNRVDTSKIDELSAKVDQLIMINQNHVFIIEESSLEQSAKDTASDTDKPTEDQQENNQQTAPIITTAPQDELKRLAMMMQQLLQGQQVQGKELNQVTTNINTRMNNMFNDLSTKYDNVASHMRQMDIQISQIAEIVRRQQGSLSGKTETNPKECNAVALRSGRQLTEPVPKRFTTAEKGKQKESEQSPLDVPVAENETEQPAEADPLIQDLHAEPVTCPRIHTKEDLNIKLPLIDVNQMIPSMRSLMKGLVSRKKSGDNDVMMVSKECSAVLQKKPIKNLAPN